MRTLIGLVPAALLLALSGCADNKPEMTDTGPLVEDDIPIEDADGDGYSAEEDCDDNNSVVNPGADEICDGVDNNCDGQADEGVSTTYYADSDGDGFGDEESLIDACEQPSGYVPIGNDCDDTSEDAYPGAAEECDGLDNDCDGEIDEGLTETYYADGDGDGFGDETTGAESCEPLSGAVTESGDCDDTNPDAFPGNTEVCDEADNDCDGETDEDVTSTFYEDVDGDAYGLADSTTESCDRPTGYAADPGDCDDDDTNINPDAEEICDELDNDCDGDIDEDAAAAGTWYADADGDGFGDDSDTTEACDQPSGYVEESGDCDDDAYGINPDAAEICDELDNDCDGDIDDNDSSLDTSTGSTFYADSDGDGFGDEDDTTDACDQPSGYVEDATDCDDDEYEINPDAAEICDELDNDCDGEIDEDAAAADTWYADSDGDGFGDEDDAMDSCDQPSGYVSDDTDCDDDEYEINPDAEEICDALDNDCDGETDEDAAAEDTWYADSDGDGYGDDSDSTEACDQPSGYVEDSSDCDDDEYYANPGESEVCDGIDNDCNGVEDDGVLGTGADCPAEDCAEILDDNSSSADGDYELDLGTYYCDMTTDGGGWTLVAEAVSVYGTGYDTSYYNSEGFSWNETLFAYNSGTVHAHCTYPSSMTGCNNLGFQFASESWGLPLNYGSSICGMSTTDYTGATNYVGGYDFSISRTETTDTVRLGTLEGVANCTTGDNPGTAYLDILVRR